LTRSNSVLRRVNLNRRVVVGYSHGNATQV
jgi:hypothetical protein